MVSAADKPADVVLLWEKNTVPWLISSSEQIEILSQSSLALTKFIEKSTIYNVKLVSLKLIYLSKNLIKARKVQLRTTKVTYNLEWR
jgi:hypothetical protein